MSTFRIDSLYTYSDKETEMEMAVSDLIDILQPHKHKRLMGKYSIEFTSDSLTIKYKLKTIKEQRQEVLNKTLDAEGIYYYYTYKGSGYYLKFSYATNNFIYFDIYSKGGKPKNSQFRLAWDELSWLERIN